MLTSARVGLLQPESSLSVSTPSLSASIRWNSSEVPPAATNSSSDTTPSLFVSTAARLGARGSGGGRAKNLTLALLAMTPPEILTLATVVRGNLRRPVRSSKQQHAICTERPGSQRKRNGHLPNNNNNSLLGTNRQQPCQCSTLCCDTMHSRHRSLHTHPRHRSVSTPRPVTITRSIPMSALSADPTQCIPSITLRTQLTLSQLLGTIPASCHTSVTL